MAHAMHCFCCASRRFVHGTHDFVLTWSSGPLSNNYALFLLHFMLAHMHLARNGRLACCQAAIHWFLLRITPDSESGANPGFCISHMHLAWGGRLALPSNGHALFLLRIMSDRAWCIWPEMAIGPAVKRQYILFTAHYAGLCITHLAWDGRLAHCLAITHCLDCASCKFISVHA